MANEGFTVVGTNIAENAAMIWNAADMLRGPFKPHEYNDIEKIIYPVYITKAVEHKNQCYNMMAAIGGHSFLRVYKKVFTFSAVRAKWYQ